MLLGMRVPACADAGGGANFSLSLKLEPVINCTKYSDESKQYVNTDSTLTVACKELRSAAHVFLSACRHDSTACIVAE